MKPVLFLAALAMAGCATAGSAPAQSSGPEAIYAAVAGKESLRLRVSSNGCTEKGHFRLDRRGADLTLVRVTPDMCKSFAIGSAWIEFSYDETGAAPFVLRNPLASWRGPGD